jgi:cytochrome c oxidase assembly protein subunit 15
MGSGLAGSNWPHRLARFTAGATVALIVAGGLVTNTGAALAVPDWPTTFGHNLFLFPWSGMVGGVLIEHGHRLLGASIGMLTICLAVALGFRDDRRWVRRLGLFAVVLVSLQGLIGGLRVVLLRETLALVHGCVAQLFFALLVGIAVVTGRGWLAPGVVPRSARRLAPLGTLAAAVVYGQVVLGAFTTHAAGLWWHVAGAIVTTGTLVGMALAVLRVAGEDPVLAWWARAVEGLLALQLVVGVGAYGVRFTSLAVPGGQLSVIALPGGPSCHGRARARQRRRARASTSARRALEVASRAPARMVAVHTRAVA